MKGYGLTVLWGLLVWFGATLFFVLFGQQVLYSPGTPSFIISTVALLAATAILLLGVTRLYLRFDKSGNAAMKFGIVGTVVGLALDTFSLANHHNIFPRLSESQMIAFACWMSFAYALYLFIPAILQERMKKAGTVR